MIYTFQQRLSKLIWKTSRLPTILILIGGLVIQFLIMLGFALFWTTNVRQEFKFETKILEVVLVLVVAPIFETLVFQYAIIDFVLTKYKSEILAIVLSATAFSLTHLYSAQYLVATFSSGILFAYIFIVFRVKGRNAIVLTFLLHATYNLVVLLLKMLNR